MSQGPEPRVTIAVRISPAGLRAVDERSEREDRSRSEMVRRMLAYAALHMPAGWKPPAPNAKGNGR